MNDIYLDLLHDIRREPRNVWGNLRIDTRDEPWYKQSSTVSSSGYAGSLT